MENWSLIAKELPTSALICIIILYILYKIIKKVFEFIIAYNGVKNGYNDIKFGRTLLSRDQDSATDVQKENSENQKPKINGKIMPFPNSKSDKENTKGGK